MNNPFGLPDEVMTAIVTAVLNQQTQATKSSLACRGNGYEQKENPCDNQFIGRT